MHVSTTIRRSLGLLVCLTAATACSDTMSAPQANHRPPFDINALRPDAAVAPGPLTPPGPGDALPKGLQNKTLNIDPNVGRTYAFGENWIYFPARAICDPATSGYGPTVWDAPCTPVNKKFSVTVHWSNKGGYAFVRFSPELRFAPADGQSVTQWVILSLHGNKKLKDLEPYSILYNSDAGTWIDESLADPTLQSWVDQQHNSVVRRVKHFSGYMVAAAYSSRGGVSDGF